MLVTAVGLTPAGRIVLGGRFQVTQLAYLVSRDPPGITSRIDKACLALVVRLVFRRREALGFELNGPSVNRIYILDVNVDRTNPGRDMRRQLARFNPNK